MDNTKNDDRDFGVDALKDKLKDIDNLVTPGPGTVAPKRSQVAPMSGLITGFGAELPSQYTGGDVISHNDINLEPKGILKANSNTSGASVGANSGLILSGANSATGQNSGQTAADQGLALPAPVALVRRQTRPAVISSKKPKKIRPNEDGDDFDFIQTDRSVGDRRVDTGR